MTISIAMPPGQYGAMRITQWSASKASCKATRCRQRVSAVPYFPSGRHGWRFGMKPKNTNKTQLLSSFLMVDQCKKAKQFWDPKQTLYSCHWWNKLHTNVKAHYLSWRAQLHFELSNVVNGQKIKKLYLSVPKIKLSVYSTLKFSINPAKLDTYKCKIDTNKCRLVDPSDRSTRDSLTSVNFTLKFLGSTSPPKW